MQPHDSPTGTSVPGTVTSIYGRAKCGHNGVRARSAQPATSKQSMAGVISHRQAARLCAVYTAATTIWAALAIFHLCISPQPWLKFRLGGSAHESKAGDFLLPAPENCTGSFCRAA